LTFLDNRFAARLRRGESVIGVSVGTLHPSLVQMCGYAGYDYLIIDNEHGPASVERTGEMIIVAKSAGITPVVRTFENDIARLLDAGAGGIQVPLVETAEQAARIVAACRYPPVGTRSVAFSTPAAGYGYFGGPAHVERSNEAIAVILMIETARAVENLDEILQVPGIDAICLGPTDMSYSLGVPGQGKHPKVLAAIEECVRKCRAADVSVGMAAFTPEDFRHNVAMGMRNHSVMLTFLLTRALNDSLAQMRANS